MEEVTGGGSVTNRLTFDVLMERIHRWAITQDDIRLALVIGSRARRNLPADSFSDLDLLLFTTSPNLYVSTSDWLDELGPHYLTFLEDTAIGEFMERRVLFADGLDVDFIPLPMHIVQGELLPPTSSIDPGPHPVGNTWFTLWHCIPQFIV